MEIPLPPPGPCPSGVLAKVYIYQLLSFARRRAATSFLGYKNEGGDRGGAWTMFLTRGQVSRHLS